MPRQKKPEENRMIKWLRNPENITDLGIVSFLFFSLLIITLIFNYWISIGSVKIKDSNWTDYLGFIIMTYVVFIVVPLLLYLEVFILRKRNVFVRLAKKEQLKVNKNDQTKKTTNRKKSKT